MIGLGRRGCVVGDRSKYRGRLQIVADVLTAAGKGSRKTHIMFRCYLSHKVLCKYLDESVRADLLRVNGPSEPIYALTDKGKLFLERFFEYSERRRQMEQSIKNILSDETTLEQMVRSCEDH